MIQQTILVVCAVVSVASAVVAVFAGHLVRWADKRKQARS